MRVYLYSSVLNAASVLCVCNFSLRMKKRSSRETSVFFDYIFSCLAFLSKKTKHLLLASFFSGLSAAQNDEMMMMLCRVYF